PGPRSSLRRAMEGGLSRPVGHVLPLRRAFSAAEGGGWVSEAWTFGRGRLFLVPGDSPVRLRLPLDSLPELKPEDYPHIVPVDPYEERGPLPSFDGAAARPSPAATGAVRTALAVEARQGRIYVFMPPVARLEDYLELIAQLER